LAEVVEPLEVRRGLLGESHGPNGLLPLEERLNDPMHAIHHPAVRRQDDGETEVDIVDQAGMVGNLPDRQWCWIPNIPVRLIEFTNVGQGNLDDGEISCEINQSVDVPSRESLRRGPNGELLAHLHL